MKIYHLASAIILIVCLPVLSAHAKKNHAFVEWANTKKPRIDLNADGTPDLIRIYKNDILKKTIYRNSLDPKVWFETKHISPAKTVTSHYKHKNLFKKVETEIKGRKSITMTYHYKKNKLYKKQRKITTTSLIKTNHPQGLMGGENVIKEWTKKNKRWVASRASTTPLSYQYGEVTGSKYKVYDHIKIDTKKTKQIEQNHFDSILKDSDTSSPIGYSLVSCDANTTNMLKAATHLLFKKMLPCMQKINPALAVAVASHVIQHKPSVQCNAFTNAPPQAKQNQKTKRMAASTAQGGHGQLARAGVGCITCNIELSDIANAEHIAKKYGNNAELMAYESANTILHETLHLLGIDHREPGADGGDGDFDAAYGCPSACGPTAVMAGTSPTFGCELCAAVTVNGSNGHKNMNKCEKQSNFFVK